MTVTSPKFFTFLKVCVASTLLLLATNFVFGDFYFQGGISFWPDYELPRLGRGGSSFINSEEGDVVRSRDLWLGAGYKLDDQWSIESFFSRLPATEVFSRLNVYYQDILLVPNTGSITLTTETIAYGIGAVYEHSINDRMSLIGKAGVAVVQNDSDINVLFPRFELPLGLNVDEFDESFISTDNITSVLLSDQEESTVDAYFAFGVNIPIQNTLASVTVFYEFLKTPGGTESGPFLGIRWDL